MTTTKPRSSFKQADVTRFVRGLEKSGLPIGCVEFDLKKGTIQVFTTENFSEITPNPWDTK